MRRNPLAVAGVVCAFALGGTLSACRSNEPVSAPEPEAKMASKRIGDAPSAPDGLTTSHPPTPPETQKPAGGAAVPAPSGAVFPSDPKAQREIMERVFQAPAPRGKSASSMGLGAVGTGAGGGGLAMKGPSGVSSNYASGVGALAGKRAVERHGASTWGAATRGGGDDSSTPSAASFKDYGVNAFVSTREDRLSTFAVDVDTASYTLTRRIVMEGSLPPREAVRVEEMLNYFRYTYPEPAPAEGPFTVHLDAAPSPFTEGRHLLRVGVQGKQLSLVERKPAHLTFLVDVSGSMQSPDRLPLAKRALRMLVDNLRDGDTVALVTYAGAVRRVLPPTGMERKALIHSAIEDLVAEGSTAMGSGIELAYQEAMKTLDGTSFSRVIILSDGDANVGKTSHEDILKSIRGYVKEGITLTTVGFGMNNYKDTMMEQLANQGNGNNFYVDSLMAARRVFQEQLGGTLEVIAQDVKLQVEFDPKQVARYRLIGYENRAIADQSFRDDRVDAGELGAGHTVTALYELELAPGAGQGLATVRVRAKKPRGESASEREYLFQASALAKTFKSASTDLRFAAAVMGAAELLRRSPHAEQWSLETVLEIARAATPKGNAEREEFLTLLERARPLMRGVAAR